MAEERRSKPSFFKVLFNDDFTLQLRLPTAFVQKHGDILHENAVLGASSGKYRVVKLEYIEEYEKCYFTRGWPKIAKDLGLKKGEFLVFWLVGKSTFDVLVYGISGCERVISNCNSEFESSDFDEEVQILSKDYISAARGNYEMSNKRAKTSILEKEATRSPGNVDRLSPLYFEKVLKTCHRSGVLGMVLCVREGAVTSDVIMGLLQACYIRKGFSVVNRENVLEACDSSDSVIEEWFILMEESKKSSRNNLALLNENMSTLGWACRNVLFSTQEQARYSFFTD